MLPAHCRDVGAAGETVSRTAIEPHLRAGLAGDDAEAVMFDFMQPLAAGRQLIGFGWEARRDEPGREGTLQHAGQIKLCKSDCNQNRAIVWSFGQLATTPASQSAWWQVPARRSTARRVGTRKREGSGGEGSGGYGTRKRRPRSRSPGGVFDAQERNCRGCQATYSEPWCSIDCANRKAYRGAARSKKSSRIREGANSARDCSLYKIHSDGIGVRKNHL